VIAKHITRPFNKVVDNGERVVKSSSAIDKLKQEYDYHYLLPPHIQRYFVKPENFSSDGTTAEYTMKNINGFNSGEFYAQGRMTTHLFISLLKNISSFQNLCLETYGNKACTEYESEKLVIHKTRQRVGADIIQLQLLSRIEESYKFYKAERMSWNSVVSHGDLCLSNILFDSKELQFKFIDPRGALTEDDLFIDEYYDLAKLSQSILGKYESVIYGAHFDNQLIEDLFLDFLANRGVSLNLLRVYEASLFLSMVPFHYDKPDHIVKFLHICDTILSKIGF
jgi:hypothetical protein